MKGYCSSPGGLTLKGFKEFMKDSVKKHGEDTVFEWLHKLGYDKQLYSSFSRSFIITMHSEQPITLQVGDTVSTNLEESAQSMILREHASVKEKKPECCLLYYPQE